MFQQMREVTKKINKTHSSLMVTGAKVNKANGGEGIPAMNGRAGECKFFIGWSGDTSLRWKHLSKTLKDVME